MPVEHSLPFNYNLLITTPNTVLLRTLQGDQTIFECESANGIVNARAATNNSSLLAIADRHVVILHNTARPREKKHRLTGGSDVPRLLLFSSDSRTLFFNTTLNNSIQAFSLPTGALLPSSHSHPSPPNVVAISSDGHILLSASSSPPTVLIQDRRWPGSAAVDFKLTGTSSAVTCAAFETLSWAAEQSSIQFVLGFKDGALALYKTTLPLLSQSLTPHHDDQSTDRQLRPTAEAALSKLHRAAMGGVTAAAFIPGYASRVISVGQDGRSTSLAVATSAPITSRGRRDGPVLLQGDTTDDPETMYEGTETLIAVGTQAGKVLVYNEMGLLVHEIAMDKPVRSVEWVGDMSAPPILPTRNSSLSPDSGPVIKALMEGIGEIEDEPVQHTTAKELPERSGRLSTPEIDGEPAVSFSIQAQSQDL
ncbi:uncharacterized protein M421DRAFT_406859, partial [Didymella exigua CBS 183.55]